jgi:DeoR/GlpR family transcriptional regulator of sugar metabolism
VTQRKLTDTEAETARAAYERRRPPVSIMDLADRYGVSFETMRRLLKGETYKDMTP